VGTPKPLILYTQVCSMGQQVVFNYLMLYPRCLLHSWPQIVTLWATITTQLRAKMAENGWKQVFDDTYLHNLLFYTQKCSMGQQVVFNYPMVSPKVLTTLMAPNIYPMSHNSHSFKSKNGRKQLKTGFWWCSLPKPLILHTNMFFGPTSGL
jgi:hypothetical protein